MDEYSEKQVLRILIVEDDDGDAKALKRGFKRAGLAASLSRARDGLEALDILRGDNGQDPLPKPHLILADLNMPRMNGIEFVSELRRDEKLSDTIVFFLSTSQREEDKKAAYNLKISGYILKSAIGKDCSQLIEMIEKYWKLVEMPR